MKLSASVLFLIVVGAYAENPEWIAVFNPNRTSGGLHRRHMLLVDQLGGSHHHSYDLGSFQGFAFSGSKDAAEHIGQHPDVAYIQPNFNVSGYSITKEKTKSWSLEAMSHLGSKGRRGPKMGRKHEYAYDDTAGNGTVVYLTDTGIDTTLDEFEGRAEWGTTFLFGKHLPDHKTDDSGHGTHVAGIVGSRSYGVAKKTQLVAVKVLDKGGFGTAIDTIRALAWIREDAQRRGVLGRAVVNISLGRELQAGTERDVLMDAAGAAAAEGLFLVAAAGNGNVDASRYSPGAEARVCNVGAHDFGGRRARFSNWGGAVDVWAPGRGISSTWSRTTPWAKSQRPPAAAAAPARVAQGTSQAAPHVAGLAAYFMGLRAAQGGALFHGADVRHWCDVIKRLGKGPVAPGDIQPLLYNGAQGRDPSNVHNV